MKIKLRFKGRPVDTEIVADLLGDKSDGRVGLHDLKRFWEMERTFNELTNGRLHVELIDD